MANIDALKANIDALMANIDALIVNNYSLHLHSHQLSSVHYTLLADLVIRDPMFYWSVGRSAPSLSMLTTTCQFLQIEISWISLNLYFRYFRDAKYKSLSFVQNCNHQMYVL